MSFRVDFDPYDGLAESVVTSNIIDARNAYTLCLTAYLSSGTSSSFTYQVCSAATLPTDHYSNWSLIPELAWSNWTVIAAPSGMSASAGYYEPPIAPPLHRILRMVSGASFAFGISKQEYV